MLGTGFGHFIPYIAYLGFFVAMLLSLIKNPLYGFYYMLPFLPYRTMRDHFLDYPLGGNVLTILVICVIMGAVFKGKRLPQSKLYLVWLLFAVYTYLSMWVGVAMSNAPLPLWLHDVNFVTWKDYMLIPLIFVAGGMVVEDRKAMRIVLLITMFSVLMIDRSFLMDAMTRSWNTFSEDKRSGGPLGYGSNQTAAFFATFAMFFWGLLQFVKNKKHRLLLYGLTAITMFADMYTFSRASYVAIVAASFVLGVVKDRKLLIVGAVFLVTWQALLPAAVTQRVNMTHDENGQLEASAQERVNLWQDAEDSFFHSPIFGIGFAAFQFGEHVDGLKDTHNWFVKVLVETGLIGFAIVTVMLFQIFALGFRLFRKARDPLFRGLGLGLFVGGSALAITNFFGDRWTYVEITGLVWALVGVGTRADQLSRQELEGLPQSAEPEARLVVYAHAGA